MKNFVITGGLGFLGSQLVNHFSRENMVTVLDNFSYAADINRITSMKNVEVIACDISEADRLDKLFSYICYADQKVDVLINCSAETHNCNSIERPGDFVQSNIVGVYNLLEQVRKRAITNSIFFSTDETIRHYPPRPSPTHYLNYDTGEYEPAFLLHSRVKEEDSIIDPSSPYSSTKAAGELLVSSWRQTYNIPGMTIVRPCNQYGATQHPEKLLGKICQYIREGKKFPLFSSVAYRDWMHSSDLVSAIDLLVNTSSREDLYHISNYQETETRMIVNKVLQLLGKDESCIEMVEDRKAYDLYYSLDSSKIRALGWKPQVTLEEGLRETVRSYMNANS